MKKQKKYEEVKKFAEDNGDGCKLLSTEWVSGSDKLRFLCKCGNEFETLFYYFKKYNKRQCNKCSYKKTADTLRLSYEEVKHFIEIESGSGCKLISEEYSNSHENLKIQCRCGDIYDIKFSNFKHRLQYECPQCRGRVIWNWHYDSVKEYIETKSNSGCKLLTKNFTNGKDKLKIQCECGREFKTSFNSFMYNKKQRCNVCSGKEYDHRYVREYIKNNSNCMLISDEYKDSQSDLVIRCNCGNKYKASLNAFQYENKRQCNECSMSKGETKIGLLLEKRNISFKSEYSFENLVGVNGGLLRFDFAILNSNNELVSLIEYDGEFHFMERYKGDGFKDTQIHDKRKNQYCKDNNIPLLRIPYWDFDNIEDVLAKFLQN